MKDSSVSGAALRLAAVCCALTAVVTAGGCVERLITVTSEPAGAQVWLNDEWVGRTPVTVPFTWYGTYGVRVEKEGFETVAEGRRAQEPVYQWPIVDLWAECLWPGTIVDEHAWHFDLTERQAVDVEALRARAQALREETLAGETEGE